VLNYNFNQITNGSNKIVKVDAVLKSRLMELLLAMDLDLSLQLPLIRSPVSQVRIFRKVIFQQMQMAPKPVKSNAVIIAF